MGAALVLAAYEAAARVGLGHVPTRLLAYMAARAKDSDAEPWSRLSIEERCHALGHDLDEAGRRAVERATSLLMKHGVLERTSGGNRYGVARYRLLLAVDNSYRASTERGLKDSYSPRSAGLEPALNGVRVRAEHGAKEKEENNEEERPSARPAARCSRHIGRDDDTPCRACGEARRAAEAYDVAHAEREADARRARAAALTDPRAHAKAIEAARQRLGGSTAAVVAAALRASPDSLPVGLRLITADDVERSDR